MDADEAGGDDAAEQVSAVWTPIRCYLCCPRRCYPCHAMLYYLCLPAGLQVAVPVGSHSPGRFLLCTGLMAKDLPVPDVLHAVAPT